MADDDQQRREHEMNMFAFHAAGADSLSSLGPTGSIAFSKPSAGASSSDASPNQDALFAAAAALEHSSTPNNKDGSSSNRTFSPTADLRPNPILTPPPPNETTPSDSIPLFTEEVLLPRPLVFGGALPDRVREVLPSSIFDTPTVRTFQPVWGNRAAKLAAHRRRNQHHKPTMVARASTAPPRISPPPPPMEETMMDTTDSEASLLLMDTDQLQADPQETPVLSEKDRFSQWALMGGASSTLDVNSTNNFADGGGTFLHNANNNSSSSGLNARSSFQTIPAADSDDDSVIEDEQRTKVGASDNLSKAIALLSEETHAAHAEEPSQVLLSQVAPDAARPLTNYELTEGCLPMFGADDAPLPQEADLGIHQTREEQLRTLELKRSHELIEKFVPPNVFGPIACPNPALGPGDCQSWNSRVRARPRSPPRPPKASSSKRDGKRRVIKQRFGWWNKPWNEEESAAGKDFSNQQDDSVSGTAGGADLSTKHLQHRNLQAPPVQHASSTIQVVTPLEPTPEQLREDNLPLSRMHAATTMAQSLPFLSDRPASFRYLQIDTQAVFFQPVGGGKGIEPLFCSVAIYNVETVASSIGASNSNNSTSSKSPTPDLQRSGRVTEALQFDYVANMEVAERCRPALWPYGGGEEGCGTRCGVFPIPSNLNVANLYAILIVRKVVGDESDFDPYLKSGKSWSDLAKLQANAEKAAERYGPLTLPFAFGVAPLLQVFGVENPVVATSRAVQIPLFHFTTGERQIIDHIMYMLHPRADHRENGVGGAASVTNGGTAMLVMRNFGYLGLHTAVDQRSSLAQNRLVDFTGDVQVRRRLPHEGVKDAPTESYQVQLPTWHSKFIGETTKNGGRNKRGAEQCAQKQTRSPDDPMLFAQELAPWPLLLAPSRRLQQSGISRGRPEHDDMEPFIYTSFCNELLCHPRILHNCPKGRLTVKLELREVVWNESLNSYCAHVAHRSVGPSIHNNRRGPFLVQSAFTSCTPSRNHHQFIDEFKVKLPLHLNRKQLAFFFTLYRLKSGSSNRWKSLFATNDSSGLSEEIVCSGRVEQVACGFLPLINGACLLHNGVHDVPIIYKARLPSETLCAEFNLPPTSFVLMERTPPEDPSSSAREETSLDFGDKDVDSSVITDNTDVQSITEESFAKWTRTNQQPLSLSVRVVAYSSLHGQAAVMNELFCHEQKKIPTLSYDNNKAFLAVLRMGRDFIISNSQIDAAGIRSQPNEEELVESTIGVGDHTQCSAAELTAHLLRITTVLWQLLVFGDGTANLVWANPASSAVLRVHAFATLLRLVGSSSHYLAKLGAKQLDGETRWNVVMTGRVIALVFDEGRLFDDQADECFDTDHWSAVYSKTIDDISPVSKPRPSKRRGHVRSNYDFSQDAISFDGLSSRVSSFATSAGDLATLPKPSDLDASDFFEIGLAQADDKQASKANAKVDTKSDFMKYLRAADLEYDDDADADLSPVSEKDKKSLLRQAASLTNHAAGGNRRYRTLPASALSTILESDFGDDSTTMADLSESFREAQSGIREARSPNSNDDFVLVGDGFSKGPFPQSKTTMRRPRVGTSSSTSHDQLRSVSKSSEVKVAVPASDDDIETMGSLYLDTIEKQLFIPGPNRDGEEKRVGSKHHRKKSRGGGWSSIDWSLTDDGRDASASVTVDENAASYPVVDDSDERMSTLRQEENASVRLPSFADRLTIIGNSSSTKARWFPFAYEVIVMQWAAILGQQDHRTERSKNNLGRASSRAVGVAAAGAPMLFEVIKQSMGFRIRKFFQFLQKNNYTETPPLLILEDAMVSSLQQVIVRVTDACLDHHNFDSPESRQMSIDVNNAIALFLRDLFSYMSPHSVNKLVIVYLSRFSEREKAAGVDRETLLGYRCSWEILKLRLNAITVFVRYADFIKVNGPEMLNWSSWWTTSPSRSKFSFFDDMLEKYDRFCYNQQSTAQKDPKSVSPGSMKPHWLSETVIDVCLIGVEHADSAIQQRSSSVLFEFFWSCSQESILTGISAPVSSMFLSYVERVLVRSYYIANFAPKCQLRKDLLTSFIFVLQSTPVNLLRALWRRLCYRLQGKGRSSSDAASEAEQKADVLDMFSTLNLSLRTMEYEGSDESVDSESPLETKENLDLWRREYLPAKAPGVDTNIPSSESTSREETFYTSSVSRQWQAHDSGIVIVKVANQIVREMYTILNHSPEGKALLNPAIRNNRYSFNASPAHRGETQEAVVFSRPDIVLFVRAASSVYLHALTLRQSDVVLDQTFVFSAELIKIFGIRLFLEAVGETLQHWMRVVSLQCGARRAQVRIAATDLLELILRSTWECFGSFFRIRVPLLAVQTEVMERIVATAAARYYKEQRRKGTNFEDFSNIGAEASLVPLWRTLDRIQNNPASQNVAFKGALIRIAGKLKKLYRAYVAARALSFIHTGAKEDSEELTEGPGKEAEPYAQLRAARLNTMRIINASEGFTKQFLGIHGTTINSRKVAHYEAVEDALIEAANVFSPTELPEHRVAWLRMLAEFHNSRKKVAEEATTRYFIHATLSLAAHLHGTLWSNTPFLPWTDDIPDPIVYIDGDAAQVPEPDYQSDMDGNDWEYGGPVGNSQSFRRIFYRVATSVRSGNNMWDSGANKNIFFGISSGPEYYTISPWISLREMEESMVEEVEAAGTLFLRAGIVESCRLAWSLAAQHYVERFNYSKLAGAYSNLASAILSRVPSIDSSLPNEVTSTLGRFYRVWFHGDAPDQLRGVEFVYRSASGLREFGEELRSVVKSIIPQNSPVHIVLDGLSEDRDEEAPQGNVHPFRIGPAQLEPVKVKVTPLRPLFGKNRNARGLPEWFPSYVEEQYGFFSEEAPTSHHHAEWAQRSAQRSASPARDTSDQNRTHQHSRSFSATVFSSAGSFGCQAGRRRIQPESDSDRSAGKSPLKGEEFVGVDKFCFVQPIDRDRRKEWWKYKDFVKYNLRVTQLQVSESFPSCITRQKVIHRDRYDQSPLEAGIDVVCQWCSILFHTTVATTGMAVMGTSHDPGIGNEAAKVVAESLHKSRIKEIGLTMLAEYTACPGEDGTDCLHRNKVHGLQLKLARLILTFVELLHLLISRNRDQLLAIMKERQKTETSGSAQGGSSVGRAGYSRAQSLSARDSSTSRRNIHVPTPSEPNSARHQRRQSEGVRSEDARSRATEDNHSQHSMMTQSGVKTESAIAVQSELQRAFINLSRSLYKGIKNTMGDATPNWFKQCGQETYYSMGTHKHNQMPIGSEMCFQVTPAPVQRDTSVSHQFLRNPSSFVSEYGCESPRGSICGQSQRSHNSATSRNSDRFGSSIQT